MIHRAGKRRKKRTDSEDVEASYERAPRLGADWEVRVTAGAECCAGRLTDARRRVSLCSHRLSPPPPPPWTRFRQRRLTARGCTKRRRSRRRRSPAVLQRQRQRTNALALRRTLRSSAVRLLRRRATEPPPAGASRRRTQLPLWLLSSFRSKSCHFRRRRSASQPRAPRCLRRRRGT